LSERWRWKLLEWSERIEKTNGDSTGYVKKPDEVNVGVIRKGGICPSLAWQ
jgi:hypothetical protein